MIAQISSLLVVERSPAKEMTALILKAARSHAKVMTALMVLTLKKLIFREGTAKLVSTVLPLLKVAKSHAREMTVLMVLNLKKLILLLVVRRSPAREMTALILKVARSPAREMTALTSLKSTNDYQPQHTLKTFVILIP
jgi:hypothetical protein